MTYVLKLIMFMFIALMLSTAAHSCIASQTEFIPVGELSEEERFISKEKLNFTVSIGHSYALNSSDYMFYVRTAFDRLEKELNVKFTIENEVDIELDSSMGVFQIPHCTYHTKPLFTKNHINICFVDRPIRKTLDGDKYKVAIGIYDTTLNTALVQYDEDAITFMNVLLHEVGHFLGSLHTTEGIMVATIPELKSPRLLRFSKESIEQIRSKHTS